MPCNESSGLYAKWDEVERMFLDAIEGELTRTDPMEPQPSEADYEWAKGIARRATGYAMDHLDGYGIEDLRDALLSDEAVQRALSAYREALEDLAGDHGCTLLIPPDPSIRREGDPCRDQRPDRPETWCYACVASQALASASSRIQQTETK